ncbi:MAG: PorV/PorQ family protein [bacterium]|nr:PorV/PorQ family protein [bacterium]
MKKYILMLVLVIFAGVVEAKTNENAGTCVGQFLKIGAGARPCGMGEAFSAVADDVNAIYWNPAGLMQVTEKEGTFMHSEWLDDLKYEFLAYCQPSNKGVRAFSITYLRMGDMEGRDKDENPIGDFGAYDYALSMAYATPVNNNLYAGITGKIIQQKIEKESAKAVAVDIGILYFDPVKQGFKVAAVLQNLGSKLKFVHEPESLPLTCKFGAAYKKNKLTLAGDLTKPQDNDARANIGVEYLHTQNLAFRLGYNSQNNLDKGWTLGAGFKCNSIQFDYGFIPYGELDNTHRFSLTRRF